MSSIMLPKVFLFQTAPIAPSDGNRTNQSEILDQTVPITPPTPPEATQPSSPTPVTLPQIDRAKYRRADIQHAINDKRSQISSRESSSGKEIYEPVPLLRSTLRTSVDCSWYREEGTDKPAVGLTLDRLDYLGRLVCSLG